MRETQSLTVPRAHNWDSVLNNSCRLRWLDLLPFFFFFFFFFFFLHAPRSTAAARGLEAGCSSSSAPSLHAFFHEHFQKHCIPLATCASSYARHAANFTPAVFVSPVHLDRIVPRRLVAVFNGHKRAECHVACDDG
jgi:hypothetical protein